MRSALIENSPRCALGESPRWDAASGRLLWVDIPVGAVHALEPNTGDVDTAQLGQLVSALARHADGWLLGVETGAQFRDDRFRLISEIEVLPTGAKVRMNDGALDPAGRFFLGSLASDGRAGAGELFRFDPDGTSRVVLQGLDVSNGIAWSLDDTLMYHVDSGTRTIRAHRYDAATGELGGSEVFYEHPADGAVPDGIALDAAGGLWVALWDGARIIRLDASGRRTDEVAVDAARPSSVAFGGPDLGTLFITSAIDDLTEVGPGDGLLHTYRPSVPGRPQKAVSTTPITWSDSSTRNSAR